MTTTQETPNFDLKFEFLSELIKPTKRDKQTRIGPSDLGNPCAKCLGRKMTGEGGDAFGGDFSLYPWLGTAGHFYLENTVFQSSDYLHEQRLYVGDVPGYGPIRGTADLVRVSEPGMVVDWKFVGLKKIKSYRANGSPKAYRYQRQLYARGVDLAGIAVVESVANVYIPRDSGNIKDIWVDEEAYQPEMAEEALERAGRVYEQALLGGYQSLPSDPDCWVCNNIW